MWYTQLQKLMVAQIGLPREEDKPQGQGEEGVGCHA